MPITTRRCPYPVDLVTVSRRKRLSINDRFINFLRRTSEDQCAFLGEDCLFHDDWLAFQSFRKREKCRISSILFWMIVYDLITMIVLNSKIIDSKRSEEKWNYVISFSSNHNSSITIPIIDYKIGLIYYYYFL